MIIFTLDVQHLKGQKDCKLCKVLSGKVVCGSFIIIIIASNNNNQIFYKKKRVHVAHLKNILTGTLIALFL